MITSLRNYLHHLFNPHCEQCALDKQVKQINPVVENLKLELEKAYSTIENLQESNPVIDVLRSELERAYRNNDRLLEQLFDKMAYERELVDKTVINPPKPNFENTIPIAPNRKSWAIRRRELENQKRLEAQELARLNEQGITPVTENDLDKELESVNANA